MNTYPDPFRDIYDADVPRPPAEPQTWRRTILEVVAALLLGAVIFCAALVLASSPARGQTTAPTTAPATQPSTPFFIGAYIR